MRNERIDSMEVVCMAWSPGDDTLGINPFLLRLQLDIITLVVSYHSSFILLPPKRS